MWELDCEEGWVPKNWCSWTVVLEKTLESPLDCKEIQLVHSEGDQPWDFFGRNDAKAETPVLWPPDAKSWLTGKDPDAERDWGRKRRGRQRMRWPMASPTQWTWVWVNSGSWWWTGRPGVLRFMGLQRVGHDWATELSWWGASLVAKMVKNLPATQKTWVWSLDRKDPLEKDMAIHSSVLAWRIPWTEEPGGLQSVGSQRVRHDSTTDTDVYMPIYRLFQFVPPQQENSRKTSTTASLTTLKLWTVWIATN